MLEDPGAKPSVTGCARYRTDSGNDDICPCADAVNDGAWSYNSGVSRSNPTLGGVG